MAVRANYRSTEPPPASCKRATSPSSSPTARSAPRRSPPTNPASSCSIRATRSSRWKIARCANPEPRRSGPRSLVAGRRPLGRQKLRQRIDKRRHKRRLLALVNHEQQAKRHHHEQRDVGREVVEVLERPPNSDHQKNAEDGREQIDPERRRHTPDLFPGMLEVGRGDEKVHDGKLRRRTPLPQGG